MQPLAVRRALCLAAILLSPVPVTIAQTLPVPRPVPLMQAVPQPDHQVSFQRAGAEVARVHFDPAANRPFVFPLIGPAGRSITRMGHPHDPESHSHHNSLWVSHHDVNGVDFWGDRGTNVGRIIHQRVEELDDRAEAAALQTLSHWTDKNGRVLLTERRRTTVQNLPNLELLLIIDLLLEAKDAPVVFGKTPFGLVGVRMARTMGVNDGGGRILNSAGNVNEQGTNGCFWKAAKWCDYSGPITPGASEGATLLDHPGNPNHPTAFHVRNDGWMGTCLTFDAARTLEPGKPLQLRYGVYVHAGVPTVTDLNQRWETFAASKPFDFTVKKK